MNQLKLLPGLAIKGIWNHKFIYIPYVLTCIFTCFTYFVFSLILKSKIIENLPHSVYAEAMLEVGIVLLTIILLPFLYYAYSFVIKRRKHELGIYSLLGLEGKHIAIMLCIEALVIYAAVIICGVILGMVFAKLILLIFLRLTNLPINVSFHFEWSALFSTMSTFGILFGCILLMSLSQAYKARPIELMSDSKRGEKEPKHIAIWGIAGVIITGYGYYIAITAKIDSMIFCNFFFAVFLVVIGTYFLFTSGSICFLKTIKKNKKLYYTPQNFITISGMLYRMKKNAASLANIAIFSTMILLTLTSTLSVLISKEHIKNFDFPYDMKVSLRPETLSTIEIENQTDFLCKKYQHTINRLNIYQECEVNLDIIGNGIINIPDGYRNPVHFITEDDYQHIENKPLHIPSGSVVVFSSGPDIDSSQLNIAGDIYPVAFELNQFSLLNKHVNNKLYYDIVIIYPDKKNLYDALRSLSVKMGLQENALIDQSCEMIYLSIDGPDSNKESFIQDYEIWFGSQEGYLSIKSGLSGRIEYAVMNGSLIFIGIIFSLIFLICLLLIMYYKQISEGYEDQNNFAIMRKVGLGDDETRKTIRKQILMVFALPLLLSFLHTAVGLCMLQHLLNVIRVFDYAVIWRSTLIIAVIYAFLYIIVYLCTARNYYQIINT